MNPNIAAKMPLIIDFPSPVLTSAIAFYNFTLLKQLNFSLTIFYLTSNLKNNKIVKTYVACSRLQVYLVNFSV